MTQSVPNDPDKYAINIRNLHNPGFIVAITFSARRLMMMLLLSSSIILRSRYAPLCIIPVAFRTRKSGTACEESVDGIRRWISLLNGIFQNAVSQFP